MAGRNPRLVPVPVATTASDDAPDARQVALDAVLEKVRRRWGYGSIVRLDGEGAAPGGGPASGPGGGPGGSAEDAAGDGGAGGAGGAGRSPAAAGSGAGRPGERRAEGHPARRKRAAAPRRRKEFPAWWPPDGAPGSATAAGAGASDDPDTPDDPAGAGAGTDPFGAVPLLDSDSPSDSPLSATALWARPRILELVGETGGGRLAVALAWIAATRSALTAVVDPAHPTGWFYPPAAAAAGVDLERLIVVRPPADSPRATLDAAAVLLRSEAFDVILCPIAEGTRIGTTFAATLATLAARAGTTLFLLAPPQTRGLGAFAEYRVRLGQRRWVWQDGEIAGVRLNVATERARAAAGAGIGGADATLPEHELTLCLRRLIRYGPFGRPAHGRQGAGGGPTPSELDGSRRPAAGGIGSAPGVPDLPPGLAADRFALASAIRLPPREAGRDARRRGTRDGEQSGIPDAAVAGGTPGLLSGLTARPA
jgi:hypothetical protein